MTERLVAESSVATAARAQRERNNSPPPDLAKARPGRDKLPASAPRFDRDQVRAEGRTFPFVRSFHAQDQTPAARRSSLSILADSTSAPKPLPSAPAPAPSYRTYILSASIVLALSILLVLRPFNSATPSRPVPGAEECALEGSCHIVETAPNNTPHAIMSAPRVSRSVAKSVLAIEQAEGAGATVRRSIGTMALRNFTPFLMLDNFLVKPGAGFPDHPHRGMTTLTYMIKGRFSHEDFKGHKGEIGPGDLQFMIAGKGIMHAEMPIHGPGMDNPFGLQLWIDLPKEHKMVKPSYQELRAEQVPTAQYSENAFFKVVCGQAIGAGGEIVSSPVRPLGGCWFLDLQISAKGEKVWQAIPAGWNAFIYSLEGEYTVGPEEGSLVPIQPFYTTVLSNKDGETGVWITSTSNKARVVIIAGEPLDQEIVQHGPFVMSSRQGIEAAFKDYQFQRNGFEGAHSWKSEIGKKMR